MNGASRSSKPAVEPRHTPGVDPAARPRLGGCVGEVVAYDASTLAKTTC